MSDATDGPADKPEIVSGEHAGASVPGLPDIDGLGGDLGDLGGLLAQAQDMLAAQADAAEREVEGVAGGGVVRIRATGTGQVLAVTIAPEVVDPDDVGMLEDLVLAALHDVNARLMEVQREAMGALGDLFGGA
ncbi:MAG TPA: YbaB/EbfC family nucleoid-associated protein [Acidimicrobiales bacterium]